MKTNHIRETNEAWLNSKRALRSERDDQQGEPEKPISREGKAKPSPLPWKLEIVNAYATIIDANGKITTPITDLELGWTDTTTGNYKDPDADAEQLKLIVRSVNAMPAAEAMAEALEKFIKIVRTSNIDRSATHEGLTNCDAISSASAALNAWKVSQQ